MPRDPAAPRRRLPPARRHRPKKAAFSLPWRRRRSAGSGWPNSSQTALNAIWYAAIVATELETHSTTQISLTVVSATLPVAIFGVLAGILVDRWDKKQVLVWSRMCSALRSRRDTSSMAGQSSWSRDELPD